MTFRYERVETPASGLRLHLNENTAGCSPKVLEALQALTREQAAFYPDYGSVVSACAERLQVPREAVLLTNGLDEGILAVSVAALRDRTVTEPEAVVVVPAFDMYAACVDAAGGRVIEIRSAGDFAFPEADVLHAISARTRIVFLTTPGNPTGSRIPPESVFRVAAAAPGAMVFVDEAYADFGGETLLGRPELPQFPNVVVGRTFAKAYGLAALRVGALVGSTATLEPIRRVVPPYSLNVCASVALCAALGDREYYEWYLEQVRESRSLLYDAFARLGLRYWPSQANFVLVEIGDRAAGVVRALAARRVYVRDRSADAACPGCVRVTAGVADHTKVCIRALEEVLCGAAS